MAMTAHRMKKREEKRQLREKVTCLSAPAALVGVLWYGLMRLLGHSCPPSPPPPLSLDLLLLHLHPSGSVSAFSLFLVPYASNWVIFVVFLVLCLNALNIKYTIASNNKSRFSPQAEKNSISVTRVAACCRVQRKMRWIEELPTTFILNSCMRYYILATMVSYQTVIEKASIYLLLSTFT